MATWLLSKTENITFSSGAFWPVNAYPVWIGFCWAHLTSRKTSVASFRFCQEFLKASWTRMWHTSELTPENRTSSVKNACLRNMLLLTKPRGIWLLSVPSRGFSVFVLEDDNWSLDLAGILDVAPLCPSSLGSTMPKLYQRDKVLTPFLELSMSLDKLTALSTNDHFL